jgi:hypothetical protein
MPAAKVSDPMVVMSLRVPQSVARKWEVFGGDWRARVRAWMVENAPKSFAEELAELEASRASSVTPPEPDSDEF